VRLIPDGGEPQLTAAEERELAIRMEAGAIARELRPTGTGFGDASEAELITLEREGELARTRFVAANLPLVAMVLGEFGARGTALEPDLFQEGCVALALAVMRFDHARGIRFATYALSWIRAYVGAAAAGQLGAMNLPVSRAAQLRSARHVETRLTQTLGRVPTMAELAAALGRDVAWTSQLMSYQRPQSLTALTPDTIGISAEREAQRELTSSGLTAELLCQLADLDRRVLEYRHGFVDGEPHSYAETARLLQISVSRVRRMEQRGLDRLRTICPQGATDEL
jgi:RNA polymerase sigma factor (sigma-70 family)